MTAPDLTYSQFMRGKRFRLQYSPACMVADPDGVWVSLEDARDEVMRRATHAPAAMTPEVRALVDEVKFIRDTILKHTRDSDGPHTITMPDGTVHTGPLVDLWHNINALIVRRLTDRLDALAALRAGGDG